MWGTFWRVPQKSMLLLYERLIAFRLLYALPLLSIANPQWKELKLFYRLCRLYLRVKYRRTRKPWDILRDTTALGQRFDRFLQRPRSQVVSLTARFLEEVRAHQVAFSILCTSQYLQLSSCALVHTKHEKESGCATSGHRSTSSRPLHLGIAAVLIGIYLRLCTSRQQDGGHCFFKPRP